MEEKRGGDDVRRPQDKKITLELRMIRGPKLQGSYSNKRRTLICNFVRVVTTLWKKIDIKWNWTKENLKKRTHNSLMKQLLIIQQFWITCYHKVGK